MSFLTGRYTSGLGDYIGRKPVLITAAIFFIISRILELTKQWSNFLAEGARFFTMAI